MVTPEPNIRRTDVTIDDVREAATRIRGSVYRSPCPYGLLLSRHTGCEVFCKLDHLQVTGSFKERGARNRLERLTPDERQRGVIAASAGNHALALAHHGGLLDIPVTVVMPTTAPMAKVAGCRAFGANVILHGDGFDAARAEAYRLRDERNLTYVHGFDDADVIAGAGTVGLEILDDVAEADAVIVPVGGGGLIAGIGVAVKGIKPTCEVIGVEAANAPTFSACLAAGEVVTVPARPTLADGLAVARMGALPFAVAKRVVDRVVRVDEAHLARAVLRLLEWEKTVLEGAGAAPLAALLQHDLGLRGKRVVLVLCGGNIDATVVGHVIERGMAADGRVGRFACNLSDRPGGLARLTAIIAAAGASVREVTHDRTFADPDVGTVLVRCVIETRDHEHIREVERALVAQGIEVVGRTT